MPSEYDVVAGLAVLAAFAAIGWGALVGPGDAQPAGYGGLLLPEPWCSCSPT